ncbi:MAG: hypothetical protein FWB71_06570 [Defluviitaleaceae bacterium]|nr:hypothetical protein [Defluviitaleaceae bacterium]
MHIWRKLAIAAEAIITAALYGLFAYFVIYGILAGGSSVRAYLFNLLSICIILIADVYFNRAIGRRDFFTRSRGRIRSGARRILCFMHIVSFKTGLYLFYLFMLIISRLSILSPELLDPYMRTFVYSVEYGILLLLPLDKFIELIAKDNSRLDILLNRIKGEK